MDSIVSCKKEGRKQRRKESEGAVFRIIMGLRPVSGFRGGGGPGKGERGNPAVANIERRTTVRTTQSTALVTTNMTQNRIPKSGGGSRRRRDT
jgi:hypothetical protein